MKLKQSVIYESDEAKAAINFFNEVKQDNISMAVFFCSPDYDLISLASELKRHFNGIDLIGCTTAGEIGKNGYTKGTITGFTVSSENFYTKNILLENLAGATVAGDDEIMNQLMKDVLTDSRFDSINNVFSFVLIDGLSIQEEKLTSTVFNALGDIPLFGGSAADEVNFTETFVYKDGKFSSDAAVISLVHSDYEFKVFKTEHFIPTDQKIVITGASPATRIVYEINGEPAAQAYANLIGVEKIDELTPEVFSKNPVVVKIGGNYYVRSIQKVNDDGSLTFYCAIDEGIVLTLSKGNDIVQNLKQSFKDVSKAIGDAKFVIGCDCILRRLEMEQNNIIDEMGKIMSDNNVIGFSTYGEQFNSMHVNQTFTGVAISKKKAA